MASEKHQIESGKGVKRQPSLHPEQWFCCLDISLYMMRLPEKRASVEIMYLQKLQGVIQGSWVNFERLRGGALISLLETEKYIKAFCAESKYLISE